MTWIVSLDPINSGDTCKIEVENNLNIIVLEDIMFGDVWFCSGQSNMGWAMLGNYFYFWSGMYSIFLLNYSNFCIGIENRTDEIEASQNYTNIRMFRVGQGPSFQPEDDLIFMRDGWTEWVDPTTEGWKYGKFKE